jgi:hypothetical protein
MAEEESEVLCAHLTGVVGNKAADAKLSVKGGFLLKNNANNSKLYRDTFGIQGYSNLLQVGACETPAEQCVATPFSNESHLM